MAEKVEKVIITPDLAREWLAKVPETQRNRRERQVVMYAQDMAEGRWQDSAAHTPIAFNEAGEMIQGQHRLAAIVKSGVTLQLTVVHGVPTEVVTNLDTGIKRAAGDALAMLGITNGNNIASLIGTYFWWQKDFKGMPSNALAHAALTAYAQENNDVLQTVYLHSRRVYSTIDISVSAVGAAMLAVRLAGADTEAMAAFEHVFEHGVSRVEGHPAKTLHTKLLRKARQMADKSGNRGLAYRKETVLLYLRAWNNFVDGSAVSNLALPKGNISVHTRIKPNNPFI